MTDKLVKIDYTNIVTKVSTPNLFANTPIDVGFTTNYTDTVLVTTFQPNDPNLLVRVSGVDERSVPVDGKFKRSLDLLLVSEKTNKRLQKSFNDSLFFAYKDTVKTVTNYTRLLNSYGTLSDSIVPKSTRKILLDSSTAITVPKISIQIPKYSSILKLDTSKILLYKNTGDSTSNQELVNISAKLNKTDLLYTTEQLNRVANYIREFLDLVDSTDDYLGEASIDDDQYALFSKKIVSWYQSSDTYSSSIEKPFVEHKSFSDISSKYTNLLKPENISGIDYYTLKPKKRVVETLIKSDSVAKNAIKAYKDKLTGIRQTLFSWNALVVSSSITYTVDVPSHTINSTLSSSGVLSEILLTSSHMPRSLDTGMRVYDSSSNLFNSTTLSSTYNTDQVSSIGTKQLVTSTSLVDTKTFETDYIRLFNDTVYSTDDYFGLANVDDDQTANVDKRLISISYASEYLATSTDTTLIPQILYSNDTVTASPLVYKSDTTTIGDIVYTDGLKEILSTSYTVDASVFSLSAYTYDSTNTYSDSTLNIGKSTSSALNASTTMPIFSSSVEIPTSTTTQDILNYFKYMSYSLTTTATLSSGGYVNTQNYFSEAYVEPGYVGTNSYFE